MTFEYMGAHPRTPPAEIWRYWDKKSPGAEEAREEAPIVAELRATVAKEDAHTSVKDT